MISALVVGSARLQNAFRLFLAARGIDGNDGAPHIVLVLIMANLIVRETQLPQLLAKSIVRKRHIRREEVSAPQPIIQGASLSPRIRFLPRNKMVNLAGKKSCVL